MSLATHKLIDIWEVQYVFFKPWTFTPLNIQETCYMHGHSMHDIVYIFLSLTLFLQERW